MKVFIPLLVIAALVVAFPGGYAHAQTETPHVIHSTKPISQELKDHLDAWLAANQPSPALYYVVTYAKEKNGVTHVSLAGVDLPSPELPEDWSMFEEGNNVVWMGTVTVQEDGTVVPFSEPQARGSSKLFLPVFLPHPAPGGGSYVAFPFRSGTGMIYGPRGVHGSGDYGTSGMYAVDLVSGDDLGASAAPPYAYASDAGTIDYICDDGVTVAVRTYNASTDDYFIYAHLLDNANLTISSTFSRGELLGAIKYGDFNDDCGWAEQQEDHYHIHWMFEPSGGAFQAEGCILRISTQKWTCGNQEIGTGGWIIGGGGFGPGDDDFTSGQVEPTFWDYLIYGFINFVDIGLIRLLPDHESYTAFYAVISSIRLMMRIAYVLIRSNLSVKPFINAILYGIAVNAVMTGLWIISFMRRALRG